MSKQTATNLFILSPLTAKYVGLYQQLFNGVDTLEELGNKIIREIKAAHAFRQLDNVRKLSNLIINYPIKEYRVIAQYYLIWCDCRELKFDKEVLELIIEQTRTYKTKALSSRGTFEWYQGNNEAALYFYTEALKSSPTISEYVDLSRAIAVLKSQEGFTARSIQELEDLIPLIRYAEPLARYEFLNSYAVELGKTGRKQEARNVSNIVLTSPFIHAYPEWQETARELKAPDHSFVAINRTPKPLQNVLPMPLVEHVKSERVSYNPPARVTSLQQWKKKMGKSKKEKEEPPPEQLTKRQMIYRIVSFYTNKDTTDYQRYKLWEAAVKIMAEPDPPEPDDEEGA